MIQLEVDVCSIDNKIKEVSPCYKLMQEVHPDIAHLFLYQVLVPSEDG